MNYDGERGKEEKNQQGLNMGKKREKGVCSVDFENII